MEVSLYGITQTYWGIPRLICPVRISVIMFNVIVDVDLNSTGRNFLRLLFRQ